MYYISSISLSLVMTHNPRLEYKQNSRNSRGQHTDNRE